MSVSYIESNFLHASRLYRLKSLVHPIAWTPMSRVVEGAPMCDGVLFPAHWVEELRRLSAEYGCTFEFAPNAEVLGRYCGEQKKISLFYEDVDVLGSLTAVSVFTHELAHHLQYEVDGPQGDSSRLSRELVQRKEFEADVLSQYLQGVYFSHVLHGCC